MHHIEDYSVKGIKTKKVEQGKTMSHEIHETNIGYYKEMSNEKIDQFVVHYRNEVTDQHVNRKQERVRKTNVKIDRRNICVINKITEDRTDHKGSNTV